MTNLRRFSIALASIALPILLMAPGFASAQALQTGLGGAANNLTGGTTNPAGAQNPLPTIIGTTINTILGVMGIVFVIMIVYAGILYMQGGLDEAAPKKAKKLIINAVIGLIIITAAYAITQYIISAVSAAAA